MKNIFTPDRIYDSVFEIRPEQLIEWGIRGCLVDLDGTLVSAQTPLGDEQVRQWVISLESAGISVLLVSNNKARRVQRFAESVGMNWVSRSLKPLPRGFFKGRRRLGIPYRQLAVIGDQLFTDVLGGNVCGMRTYFIRSIDREKPFVKFRYEKLERPLIERVRRNDHG